MEDENYNIKEQYTLQSAFIQKTLASWRFFLLFSIPPLVWGLFIVPLSLSSMLIILLCGIVWIGCWRLWLDEHYFKLISAENNELAGKVLYIIWHRQRLQELTLTNRQLGALNLFRRTMWLTVTLWFVWLTAKFWHI